MLSRFQNSCVLSAKQSRHLLPRCPAFCRLCVDRVAERSVRRGCRPDRCHPGRAKGDPVPTRLQSAREDKLCIKRAGTAASGAASGARHALRLRPSSSQACGGAQPGRAHLLPDPGGPGCRLKIQAVPDVPGCKQRQFFGLNPHRNARPSGPRGRGGRSSGIRASRGYRGFVRAAGRFR